MPDFGIMRGFNEKLFGDKLVAGQLPTQLGLIGSQEVNDFDADSVAFFNRVTAAGGSLSATEKTAVNTLVVQMKADGIWTPIKAIYPMVGASSAACSRNLKSDDFNGTFSTGWTFASTGVTPNGSSAYMDTNLNPSTVISGQDSHISYYSRTNNNILGADIGCGDIMELLTNFGNRFYADYPDSSRIDVPNSNSSGYFTVTNDSSNGKNIYRNSINIGASAFVNSNFPNANVGIATWSVTNPNRFSNREIAFTSIGPSLNNTQVSNFYTAVQAFQEALNREV